MNPLVERPANIFLANQNLIERNIFAHLSVLENFRDLAGLGR